MKCRVIGLESRTDRLAFIPDEMKKIQMEWEFFPAVDPIGHTDLMRATSYSFMEVMKGVDDDLLVCESDVEFVHQARYIFDCAMSQIPQDYDLLYFGGNIHEPAKRYSLNLFRIQKGVHCNHAILYSKKGIIRVLENYDWEKNDITPYDQWLYHVGQNILNCYICSPMIAFQRASYSDSAKQMVDYFIEMRSNEIKNMV